VNATQAFGALRAFGGPVIETREAAALLRTSVSSTSRLLRAMSEAGVVRRIRHGLWALDPDIDPFGAVPYLTSPYPAYVSLWSALATHDMIEQIPAQIYVASLDRTQRIATGLGPYSIHHVAPQVFGGFEGDSEHGYVATAEKALFDTVYIRGPRGGRARFPELALPADFDTEELDAWTARVLNRKLRTVVARGLEYAVSHASS
jgi:predicted transcriptional regulator of viral defense system